MLGFVWALWTYIFGAEPDRHICLLILTSSFLRASFCGFFEAGGVPAGLWKRSDHALQTKLLISGERRWHSSNLKLAIQSGYPHSCVFVRFNCALLFRFSKCRPDKNLAGPCYYIRSGAFPASAQHTKGPTDRHCWEAAAGAKVLERAIPLYSLPCRVVSAPCRGANAWATAGRNIRPGLMWVLVLLQRSLVASQYA